MKKFLALLLVLVLLFSLSGCFFIKKENQKQIPVNKESVEEKDKTGNDTAVVKPIDAFVAAGLDKEIFPLEFCFTSGAGAWMTELTLYADGTFSGVFHDSDAGDIDEDYPHGTVYGSNFKGNFTNIKKIDDTTYSLTMEDIKLANQPDTSEIVDGFQYIHSTPYGIERGKDYMLYLPGKNTEGLNEDFLMWDYEYLSDRESNVILRKYALHNLSTNYGFYTLPISY